MTNVSITGQQDNVASYQPLITYIPVLLPQQTVDVPFTVTYSGSGAPAQQGEIGNCLGGLGGLAGDFADGLNAILNGGAICPLTQDEVNIGADGFILLSPLLGIEAAAGFAGGAVGCVLSGLFGGASSFASGGHNTISVANAPSPPQSAPDIDASGGGCLAPETLVLMADGTSKPIAEVKTNDMVRCGERLDNVSIVREVRSVVASDAREIQLTTADGDAVPAVTATIEHLFWVDGNGWRRAADLKPGDWLFNSKGARLHVTGNRVLTGRREMFTLGLALDNAFYGNNVLVHDMCGPRALPPEVPIQTAGVAK
jgi:hypothetical protein